MSEEIKGVVKVLDTEEGACIKISGKLDSADRIAIASTFIEMLAIEYDTSAMGLVYRMPELNRKCPMIFEEEEE